ncbi:hypothetical protein [Cohnella sp.]|uniref:hypothetical protein n=1 Tax=Cohnella sp. TaxID=1883426 RepID=UPI003569CE34
MNIKMTVSCIVLLLLLSSCNKGNSDATSQNNAFQISTESVVVENINPHRTEFTENNISYKGIQYDVISILKNIPKKYYNQIGVGLQFSGRTKGIFGKSDSGYVNGFSLLESSQNDQKILTSILIVSNSISDEEINYLISEEAKKDLSVNIYDNNALVKEK